MAGLVYQTFTEGFAEQEKNLRKGLDQFADQEVGLVRDYAGIFCYDADKVMGGVTAHLIGGSLTIKLLWVHQDYRGQSIASNLMKQMQSYGIEKGCLAAFVDTMSYQAPKFYEKIGYTEVARVKGFYAEAQYDRVFYRKDLV